MIVFPKRGSDSGLSLFASVCTTVLFAASTQGYAADTGCKAVFDAMLRLPTLPYHSFSTIQMPGVGKISSEMINDGKKLYLLHDGKWTISKLTPQDLIAQENENIRNNKTTCTVLRDETIDGVSATLYSVQESDADGTTNSQVWLSKANGLPVHTKADMPADTRYVYSEIAAPPIN